MAWKTFYSKSVMARYTAQAAVILLICSLVMGSVLLIINTKYQINGRYDTANQQLSGLSHVIALSLYNVDPTHTQTIINGLDAYDLYSEILVKDVTDNIVAHHHWPRHEQQAALPNWLNIWLSEDAKTIIENDIIYLEPMGETSRKIYVGSYRATINTSISSTMIMDTLLSTLGAVMIELLILTLVFVRLFKRDVAHPLQDIASQIEGRWPPEDGKSVRPIDIPDSHKFDEIGQFVTAFNRSLKLTSDYMSFLKEDSDKAYTLSKTDTLTGAENLRGINQKLDEIIDDNQYHWLIAMIDIDSFSQFNDSFGHDRGDVVLGKLFLHIEESMGNTGFIGRLSGGTFIYITFSHKEGFSETLHRLENITSLELNEMVLSSTYTLTCSVGVLRVHPHQYHDPRKLITNANAALQKAKGSGRGCVKLFDRQLAESNAAAQATRVQLLEVIKNQSFTLVYQPKIDMRDYRVVGCEVLLRLPESKDHAPHHLIEMAEKTGLIVQLGSQVLNKAIKELSSIYAVLPDGFKISINASPKQLCSEAFQEAFMQTMRSSAIRMNQLDIEITEFTSLQDSPETYNNFHWLNQQGCSITLDDFGTGFSTMEYLIKAGFDQIKLDRSFIRSLPGDDKSRKVIQGILYLADLFNLHIVAEGVETEEQESWLLNKQVYIAQGFLYAKGLDIHSFKKLLENKSSIRNTV